MKAIATAIALLLGACLVAACAVTPLPFSAKDHAARAVDDLSVLHAGQEPLAGPLGLQEAIARAIAYNYDHRLAMMEAVLQDRQLASANVAQLPRLAANAGFTARGNELASSSISYETRQTTLEPSVSSQQLRFAPDLTLSWSVLDLGLSYFQAKQQADRYLVAQERRRRVVNNIVKEVIAAWWKAYTAQRIEPALAVSLAEAETALALLVRQELSNLAPPVATLEQQKGLLQIAGQLRRVQSDLALARSQLAALVNLPLADPYTLDDPPEAASVPPRLSLDLAGLETLGLTLRPDLREEMYQERIDRTNVWKEVIRFIPVLSQAASLNYDSNIFLVNNFWAEIGLRVTANLLGLVQGPKAYAAAKAQLNVDRTRRLALTVAALVQINLGYRQYQRAARSFEDADALYRVDERLLKVADDSVAARAEPELEGVRRRLATLASALERNKELAEAYRALANLYFAVGADIVPQDVRTTDINALTAMVDRSLGDWQAGRFPSLPGPGPADGPASGGASTSP